MNKCRYCGKEWVKTEFAFEHLQTSKAQKEWSIQMKIQEYTRCLNEARKELKKLKEEIIQLAE